MQITTYSICAITFVLAFIANAAPFEKRHLHEVREGQRLKADAAREIYSNPGLTADSGHEVKARQDDPKVPCPSVQEILDWLNNNKADGERTVFWTSGADENEVRAFSEQVDGRWFRGLFEEQQPIWQARCKPIDRLVGRMSEALALSATGQTYILLGEYAIGSDSVWLQREYPNLSDVTITAVNALDTSQQQDYVPHENPWAT